jgi:hypothetical protein
MPASEARIAANRRNSLKSCGPRTPAGKAASSANSLKHGLTATKLIPRREADEVERRTLAFVNELNPTGYLGEVLVRHAARMSVRMERCGEHENALLVDHVQKALADFVPPEGAGEEEITALRREVERRALMDPSKEAERARKYELSAERGFFRALKELRLHERAMKAAVEAELDEMEEEALASFSPVEEVDVAAEARNLSGEELAEIRRSVGLDPFDFGDLGGRVDVPIAIGRRR